VLWPSRLGRGINLPCPKLHIKANAVSFGNQARRAERSRSQRREPLVGCAILKFESRRDGTCREINALNMQRVPVTSFKECRPFRACGCSLPRSPRGHATGLCFFRPFGPGLSKRVAAATAKTAARKSSAAGPSASAESGAVIARSWSRDKRRGSVRSHAT